MPMSLRSNCGFPYRWRRSCWVKLACVAAVLIPMVGCGGGDSPEQTLEERQGLKAISVLYGTFLSMNGGQPPASGEQLKEFAGALKQNGRVPMGLDLEDLDSIFVSPRDGEPYVLLLGENALNNGGDRTAIAYEQTGRDGMRQIALSNTAVVNASAEEFAKYVPDAQ